MTNPIHPGCDRPSWNHSKTKSGSVRYKCPCCNKVWNPSPKKGGRPPKGLEPMSAAERKRQQRLRKKRDSKEE